MRSIAIALVATVCVCSLHATSPTLETARWWGHVRALADDAMEGRDTGSRGYERAARYVVNALKRAGLKPGNAGSYYQTVPLHVVRFRADASSAQLVRGAATRTLVPISGNDVMVSGNDVMVSGNDVRPQVGSSLRPVR